MNLLQLVLKQMRQRALGTWLTLLSVLLGVALAWVLRRQEVTSCIIGASKPKQVEENAEASGVKLEEEVVRRMEEVLS